MEKKDFEKNVVVAVFKVESEGYQALSELRQAASGDTYLVSAAALVKKTGNACFYLDGFDTGAHTANDAAVGGLIGSSFFGWLFGFFFMKQMAGVCLLLGLIGGMAGMAGDLTESAFKRKMGIKDYGKLIPGHGGIMDRFDSVIFVAPVIYYLIFIITDLMPL